MSEIFEYVDAEQARDLIDQGVRLVDVREVNEYERARIKGAENVPLSQFRKLEDKGTAVLFYCLSGRRTSDNAEILAQCALPAKSYILKHGIKEWAEKGLPIESEL